MKKIKIKIPNWVIVVVVIILAVGLTSTFVKASGRFNLPLSWILTPSGTSVDSNNNGIIDNTDAGVPSGMIAMFDTDCPSGWTRVSDLDGKFLTGGSSYNAAAGGSDSITLAEANLPSHSHGDGSLSAVGVGNHTHSIRYWGPGSGSTVPIGGQGQSGTDFYSNPTANGAHGHTISGSTGETGSGTAFNNRPAYATIVICKKD